MIHELSTTDLRWFINEKDIDLDAAEKEIARAPSARPSALGQERALSALDLGLGIPSRGFNIFVVGASGTGRTSTVVNVVKAAAKEESTPDDSLLLYNFDDRDRPLALRVPPGSGPKIKKTYETLVEKVLLGIEKVFESDHYVAKRQELDDVNAEQTDALLSVTEVEAKEAGFLLARNGNSMTLSVATEDGQPMAEEAFDSLDQDEKDRLEGEAEKLQTSLEDALRKVRLLERDHEEEVLKLDRAVADKVIAPFFESAKANIVDSTDVEKHLDRCHEDMLQRIRRLAPDESDEQEAPRRRGPREDEDDDSDEPALLRYRVNVLVTHSSAGAPVVQETHPTAGNLLGRIEHRIRSGESSTDFTCVKAGAIFRANNGYLVLQAQDLLRDPMAWEGLKRGLKNRAIDLDEPGESSRMVAVASLRPEPLPLEMKVILIGTPELYYSLARADPDFSKLFKVKVDFDLDMLISDDRLNAYVRFLVGVAHEEGLRPIAKSGAARVLEHACRLTYSRLKLTTRFGWIADLLREASYFAGKDDSSHIEKKHVMTALRARADREGFLETRMRDDIIKRRITVQTKGEVVGQTNGLTVLDLGSYAFGMPVRITARTGAGQGRLVDIERETELGGPIHTKGHLILHGFMLDQFARETPLQMTGTIALEQSYSDIDGDSATIAEACALLSSLSGIPVHQHFAMTGSMDQRGQVQAVGGVNEKIEGFYRVCKALGDDTPHTVIIPRSNEVDLMLDEEVVEAQKKGIFNVVSADTVQDVFALITGVKWEGKDGAHAQALGKLRKLTHVQRLAKEGEFA